MRNDDRAGPNGTILGSGLGPWLISDRPKGWEWESFARREPKASEGEVGAASAVETGTPTVPKMIEASLS